MAPKARKGGGASSSAAASASSEASVDRKLKSVYEMIDSRNYKGALKQLAVILQKSKDNAHVLTIKAITLERMGRAEESLAVCRKVMAQGAPALCNENVLHDLEQVLARLGHGHEAVGAYEVAAAARPDNTELQQALFGALVRAESFATQQQVAMRLYKRRSGAEAERLIMTAVCSLMLQGMEPSQLTGACSSARELEDASQRWQRRHTAIARSLGPATDANAAVSGAGPGTGVQEGKALASAQQKQRAVLQLGEALSRKHIQEHGLKSLESLLLLVRVLKLQGKFSEALDCLEGPHAALFTIPADLLREKADVLLELGSLHEASRVFRELVRAQRADDWATTLHFLDASLLSALLAPEAAQGTNASDASETPEPGSGPQPVGSAKGRGAQAMRRYLAVLFGDGGAQGAQSEAGGDAEEAAETCRQRLVQALASLDESQEELHRAATSASGAALGGAGNGNGDGNGKEGSGENGGAPGPSRGLMLADVELAWRKWRLVTSASGGVPQGDVSAPGGGAEAVVDAALRYFLRFGGKPCFASDVRKYVAGLPPSAQRTLLGRLWGSLGYTPGATPWARGAGPGAGEGAEGDVPSAAAAEGGATDASAGRALRLRQLGTLISVLRVEGDVGIAAPRDGKEDASGTVPGKGVPDGTGNSTPPEEGTAAGSEGGIGGEGGVWEVNLSDAALVRRAAWAVRQYLGAPVGPTVDPKEQGEADALLEVAANSLIEVYRRGGCRDQGLFLITARLLHLGLARRPFSPQHNIMLVCLYLVLGCPSLAIRHYGQLQTKHIQLDTLGHLLLPGLCQLASSSSAATWTDTLRFFHQHIDLEAGELSLAAYTHGTFSKVPEFLRLKRRLALSHHLLWMRVQDSLAQLAGAATEPELAGVRGALEAQEENPLGLSQGGADRLAGVIDRLASVSFNEDLSVRPWWHPAPDIVYLDSTGAPPPGRAPPSWRPQESDAEREARELRWSLRAASQGLLPRILSLALSPFLPPPSPDTPPPLTPSQSLAELQQLAATWHHCAAAQAADSAEHHVESKSAPREGQSGAAGAGSPSTGNGQPNGVPGPSGGPLGASREPLDPSVLLSLRGLQCLVAAATAVLREASGGAPADSTGAAEGQGPKGGGAGSEKSLGGSAGKGQGDKGQESTGAADSAGESAAQNTATTSAEAAREEGTAKLLEVTAAEALAALGFFVRQETAFLSALQEGQDQEKGGGSGVGSEGSESKEAQEPRGGTLPLGALVAGRMGVFTGQFLPLLVLCLRAWRARGTPGASSKKAKDKGGTKGGASGGAPKVHPLCPQSASALESLVRDTRGAVKEILGCLQQTRKRMERLTGEKGGKASGTPDLKGLAALYTDIQTQAKSTMQYSIELNEAREILEGVVIGGEGALQNPAEPNMSPLGLGSAQHLALVLGSQQGFVTSRVGQVEKLVTALGQL